MAIQKGNFLGVREGSKGPDPGGAPIAMPDGSDPEWLRTASAKGADLGGAPDGDDRWL